MTTPIAFFRKLQWLPLILWGSLLAMWLLSACMSDEEYSISPSDRLAFSTDSIQFDTIISGQPTHTYTFEVYNKNENAIRISSVHLEKGAESAFHVNADGVYLENGNAADLEISGRDSMRVFLFANASAADSDLPIKHEDRLIFVTEGGVRQEIVLTAYSQDVIKMAAVQTQSDTMLTAKRPYVITDSLVVGSNTTLTIAAGVRLYFHPEANLIVRGTLLAQGSPEAPVIMRGDRLGYMFSQQPYDRIPGQWGGIVLAGESYGNHLDYCDIHSGAYGIVCDSADVNREKLRLENSIVHNVSGDVLRAKAAKVFVGNTQLTNAGGNCVTLLGGDHTFVHCTIGNFYAFAGGRGVALSYTNAEGDTRLPLYNAAFLNCLITGYSADEIMGSSSDRYKDDPFSYLFRNCLLNTPVTESEGIVNCLWDNDDHEVYRETNFSPEFDLDKLIFTFELDERSQAIDHADPEITRAFYPQDPYGNDRFADEGPDIGCYEKKKTPKE